MTWDLHKMTSMKIEAPKSKSFNVRDDFPILHQTMHDKPLIYLDSANTTQKPRSVVTAMNDYYYQCNANIHRSVYSLSEIATDLYEASRKKIQHFINAKQEQEIIFVKGTTEGINLIASSFAKKHIQPGDEILVTEMEHHSNIVPWQFVCEQYGAQLKVVPISDAGELDLTALEDLLTPRTRLLALTHVSNVLGTVNPIKEIVALAHARNIPVLVDGAQAASHAVVDVQDLDCDFYVFSGHKIYGPTGIGVLYGKRKWLEDLPPYQGGGSMIKQVSFAKTTYQDLPYKFEAGTQNIAAVIGLGAAIDYVNQLGIQYIADYEHYLLTTATAHLMTIAGLRIIGTAQHKASVISFLLDDIHPHDLGTALATYGIALRVGHHCAMPLMERLRLPATARISFGIYNTETEISQLLAALLKIKRLFQR